jgi:hypothetical protein
MPDKIRQVDGDVQVLAAFAGRAPLIAGRMRRLRDSLQKIIQLRGALDPARALEVAVQEAESALADS